MTQDNSLARIFYETECIDSGGYPRELRKKNVSERFDEVVNKIIEI
jgi:hypothetical protein